MSTSISAFSRTCRIFENCKHSSFIKHEIDFPSASHCIKVSSQFFRMLDRTDPVQSEISRRLWVLRSSVLFTVLPFDDPDLRLLIQVSQLEQAAIGLPDAAPLIDSLRKVVADIVSEGRNPKREWLARVLPEVLEKGGGYIGFLTGLSPGRSPGWPQERYGLLAELCSQILPIGSRRDLRSNLFETVILPCACSNVHPSLLSELFFAGLTTKLEVLLYPGERFQMPKRLMLPSDCIFSGHLQSSKIENEVVVVPVDRTLPAVDTWMNEAFWHGLHGAARGSRHELSPAKYILFCDGTGTFLPADGRVITLPADGKVNDENDLFMVRIDDVCEGDIVVMRSGDPGLLLDEASERIIGREGNEYLLEMATDWKDALDALLVSHTNEEVAEGLRERGVSASSASIQNWIGPDVLGPGDERVFHELIYFLAAKGKIQKVGTELTKYAAVCWQSLQSLRGLHHKAGNLIRQDLFKALFSRLGKESGCATLSDRESISINGGTEAQLLILRVAAVDSSTAYVQPSRLGKIDDLVGNKWLG